MIAPPLLCPGDLIGLVSPAKKIDEAHIENAVGTIRDLGYCVKPGKHLLEVNHYFAGTDEQRAADFQEMLDDPEVKMILCSRGGYGSARIIDLLDFSGFIKNPKWIAGYSDITVFHSHMLNLGFESLHCTMPLDFPLHHAATQPVKKLFQFASGIQEQYRISANPNNRPGFAEGILTGGNLSLLCTLPGSKSDVDTSGKILFIEEVGEKLYRLDRMMVSLKRAGKLAELKGLLIGGLTDISKGDPDFGISAEAIINDAVSDYKYPVAFGFPAGHFPENYPLIMGRDVKLLVENDVLLEFENRL
ncbi:MAG: LD-carboxypeptidase [Bacteroidales bacterium]|nr:LD-carboxypeptidase [Bacteroidales bacterium]